VAGSEFEIECQVFVEAVGTRANPLLTQTTPDLALDRWGRSGSTSGD
jgi:glutamate synthase (NADPH/NADH) small chain